MTKRKGKGKKSKESHLRIAGFADLASLCRKKEKGGRGDPQDGRFEDEKKEEGGRKKIIHMGCGSA